MDKIKRGVKNCHKSGEIRENCDTGRKPGEGDERRESPGKIGRVGKYASGFSGFLPPTIHGVTSGRTSGVKPMPNQRVDQRSAVAAERQTYEAGSQP